MSINKPENETQKLDKFANKSKSKPLQFQHHLHKAVFKKNQLPSYFIFYPTSRCNLMCSHCFYHDSLNKKMNELNLDEIDARTIGIFKFSKRGLKHLTSTWDKYKVKYWDTPWMLSGKSLKNAYMTDIIQALIQDGFKVRGVKASNGWLEFDTNEDYEKALLWQQEKKLEAILGSQL